MTPVQQGAPDNAGWTLWVVRKSLGCPNGSVFFLSMTKWPYEPPKDCIDRSAKAWRRGRLNRLRLPRVTSLICNQQGFMKFFQTRHSIDFLIRSTGIAECIIVSKHMKIKNAIWLSLLAFVLTLPGIANADVLDYAVTLNNELGTIDLQTGVFTQLGTVNGISSGDIGDLARLPGGLLYGINASSELVLIDPVALTTSVVGVSGNSILGLAFRPGGTLFGVSLNSRLYTINPSTGAATLVAALTGTGFPGIGGVFDIKFDNTGNTYLLSANKLYTINTSNGQTTLVGAIGFSVYALDLENGTLYGFTTDGKIISINTTTGAGVLVATQSQTSPIIATDCLNCQSPREWQFAMDMNTDLRLNRTSRSDTRVRFPSPAPFYINNLRLSAVKVQ